MKNIETTKVVRNAKRVFNDQSVVGFYDDLNELFPKEEKVFAQYLKNGNGQRILDVGSGTGRVAAVLSERGYEVTGIDFSPAMVDQAKKKHPKIDFRVMDVRDMNFLANTFDYVIFCYNGLDYIGPHTQRLQVLRDLYEIIKPGGFLLYSSHNSACLLTTKKTRWVNLGNNVLTGRVFTHYRRDSDPREVTSVLFYQNPRAQQRRLEDIGFAEVKLYGDFESYWRNFFSDAWPYYVAKKPIT